MPASAILNEGNAQKDDATGETAWAEGAFTWCGLESVMGLITMNDLNNLDKWRERNSGRLGREE